MTATTTDGLTVQRQHLLQALNQVTPAVRASGIFPALTGVRLRSHDGTLTVTATDLDVWCSSTLHVDGPDLEVLVPAKLLQKAVRHAAGPITFATADDQLTLRWGRTVAEVRTLALADYPRLAPVEGDPYKLAAADVDTFRRVANFASRDDARPILTGVLLGGSKAVATDSYRLAIGELTAEAGEGPALVPAGVARFLPRLLDSEHATVTSDGRAIEIALGEVLVGCNLIQGDFPPYEQLIPKAPATITFRRDELIDAVRTAAVFCSDATPVRLELDHPGPITVRAVTQDVGQVATQLDAVAIDGALPSTTAAFNPEYLLAALTTCRGDVVTIGLVDALKPVTIIEPPFTLLLMPVRCS